ncbi:MAG: ChaN family lipoprotein [Bacteroidia bacterium]|nr:ChaN family lipoprotein [Bacteroidia bacterium]MDW8158693.1 ChaN family lipoprotein [Bacteroidia bacterium]
MLISLGVPLSIMAQKKAYCIFTARGKKTDYGALFKKAQKAQVILFGELHNNPIAHWLQYELIKDLVENNIPLIIGGEMFEADIQNNINAYFANEWDTQKFESSTELWPNYATDYKPILEFARKYKINLVATNIPRKYARLVARSGLAALDTLSEREKRWMAPLPIQVDFSLPGYQAMKAMVHGGGTVATENFIAAQAMKDATMAYFIYQNLPASGVFVHLNGAYHSNNYEGIYWYLKKYSSKLKILTISTVEQVDLKELDKKSINLADFVIAVPITMTKTY